MAFGLTALDAPLDGDSAGGLLQGGWLIRQNGGVVIPGVEYLASYGIRLLVYCAKENAASGGGMALFGAPAMVRATLEMAGIPRLILLCADEAEAGARVA